MDPVHVADRGPRSGAFRDYYLAGPGCNPIVLYHLFFPTFQRHSGRASQAYEEDRPLEPFLLVTTNWQEHQVLHYRSMVSHDSPHMLLCVLTFAALQNLFGFGFTTGM